MCRPFHIVAIAFLAFVVIRPAVPALAQVAIIAHPGVSERTIDQTELLDFFTRDVREWRDGTDVVLFDLKEKGPVRDRFYEYLGIRPSRMKSIWLKQLYAGEGQPPGALETHEEMLERIARTRGAIGYVHPDVVIADEVKVLLVIEPEEEDQGG